MWIGALKWPCYFRSGCDWPDCGNAVHRQGPVLPSFTLNNEAGWWQVSAIVLGDGICAECQLLVGAAKHKDLQKVRSLSGPCCYPAQNHPSKESFLALNGVLLQFCRLPAVDFAAKIWEVIGGHICDLLNPFCCPSVPKEVLFIIH